MTAQMSAASVADALITGSLLYYLNNNKAIGTHRYSMVLRFGNRRLQLRRHESFCRINSLINRVIMWTVKTALLTGYTSTPRKQVLMLILWCYRIVETAQVIFVSTFSCQVDRHALIRRHGHSGSLQQGRSFSFHFISSLLNVGPRWF